MPNKHYLGDQLYVETCAPDWIILTSDDGVDVTAKLVFVIEMVKKFKQIVDKYMETEHQLGMEDE